MTRFDQDGAVPGPEALRALERVLKSRAFASSNRLSQFLRYTVEQTVEGNADVLKEYTIGTHAYGRRSDFDPSQDTIVRTEARRLRKKLKEYYEDEGKLDDVVMFFRSGSYVPIIRWRQSVEGLVSSSAAPREYLASDLWVQGDGVWVSVAPLSAPAEEREASSFAFGLAEEILHRINELQGVRAVAAPGGVTGNTGNQHPQAQVIISGTVRREQDVLRVIIRLTSASGLMLWSQRYDAVMERGALLKMQEAIAAALLSRISPREMIVQQFSGTPTEALLKLYTEVLAAEALLEESTLTSISKALHLFEKLQSKAPGYTRIDCGIVQCCVGLAQRGMHTAEKHVSRAVLVARQAVLQSPEQPEAHSVLGLALAQEWKWAAAEESFRTALRLGNQHSIHRQFGMFFTHDGKTARGVGASSVRSENRPFFHAAEGFHGAFFLLQPLAC
ncbi:MULTISPECIES: hypothetical protein [Acidobacterium]|uniref:Tetratricopeptide repeat protein n=1 Tax=Acidobacterium capsulatum (strain ATCC 51196 / DSM 11244 / BCRC 80197 / JCM 7670 / NBRC 15755 / NCIMB 13165 / 161) TaxID=240015 RepID=C1F5D7_ACIC5|nr:MULTISPECIES: hypothetical protein [Acidobacterium]ACO33153.1 tetratricopeptide repeat protein [Acidobacterium capsulatum ATCC 51196]HCT60024.1 hypothetical protein [Acidobacterium sp.]